MNNKKTFRKYAITTMAAATATAAVVPAAVSADTQSGFPDVSESNSHYDAIMQLTESGAIKGFEDGTFRPYAEITRGQVAVILTEQLGLEVPKDVQSALAGYSDVDADHRYAAQIAAVTEADIFKGSDGKFGAYENISRQQMATALVNGLKLADYDEGENVEVNLDKVSESHKANVQILANLDVTVQKYFDGYSDLERGAFATFLVKSLDVTSFTDLEAEIESVSAINAKTLKVDFNKEVDVNADNFSVKKGSVKANVDTVAISKDKKSAEIKLTSKLTEGEYTVNIERSGKDTLTGSVKVANEKVSMIDVLSDKAPFVDADKDEATVAVQVQNQYGEDITKVNAGDVEVTVGGVATGATLSADGVLTIDLPPNGIAKDGDKVNLVLVHPQTGVSTTTTVELSAVSAVSELAFGDVYNKDGKTLSQDTDLSKDKFYLPVTATDQYGKAITDKATFDSEVLFTNTNPAVADLDSQVKTVKIDGKEVLALEVNDVNLAGTSNIIAVSKTTGGTATASVTVDKGVTFENLSLGAPSEVLSAGKDAYFPLNVTDSNGEEITTLKELNGTKNDSLSEASNYDIVERNGKEGLFVEVPAVDVNKDKTVTVVVTSEHGKVATKTLVAKEAAKPAVVTGIDSKKSTDLRANKNGVDIANTDLIVEDQYGQKITDEAVLSGLDFDVALEGASSKNALHIDGATTDLVTKQSVTVKPQTDTSETSGKVTFKLADATYGTKVSQASAFTQTFDIVSDSQFESYVVEDVPTIYAAADVPADPAKYEVEAAYNQELVVKGKTSSGKLVKLDQGDDYTVTGQPADGAEVEFAKGENTATKTATITINDSGEEITKDLTYSNVAPKVEDVTLIKEGKFENHLKGEDVALTSTPFTAAEFGSAEFHTIADIVVTDQYGQMATVADDGATTQGTEDNGKAEFVDNEVAIPTYTFTKPSEGVKFVDNGTADAKVTEMKDGSTFEVRANIGNQKSGTVKVSVTGDYSGSAAAANTQAVSDAKTEIEGATYDAVENADLNTAAEAKTHVEGIIDLLDLKGASYEVTETDFTAAVATTSDGSYKFTVKVTKGAAEDTTSEQTLTINQ